MCNSRRRPCGKRPEFHLVAILTEQLTLLCATHSDDCVESVGSGHARFTAVTVRTHRIRRPSRARPALSARRARKFYLFQTHPSNLYPPRTHLRKPPLELAPLHLVPVVVNHPAVNLNSKTPVSSSSPETVVVKGNIMRLTMNSSRRR